MFIFFFNKNLEEACLMKLIKKMKKLISQSNYMEINLEIMIQSLLIFIQIKIKNISFDFSFEKIIIIFIFSIIDFKLKIY